MKDTVSTLHIMANVKSSKHITLVNRELKLAGGILAIART